MTETASNSSGDCSAHGKPVVVLAPEPQRAERIFAPEVRAELERRFELIDIEGRPELIEEELPRAFAIVGQPDLPQERLVRASLLRALLNVEGNFFPNVDYATCFNRGIYVLGCGPAYAQAVAEYALGLALDLARGITREDRAFRANRERYVAAGNSDAMLLRGAPIGLIGFGNLGRALLPLLAPFRPVIYGYDPWLPDSFLRESGVLPVSLNDLLVKSVIVFVLATVTDANRHLLAGPELDLLPAGARLVLVSRAPVVNYGALLDRVAAGRLTAAIDVWPEEPVPPDDRSRQLEGLVLSAHRAGGIPQAFYEIGQMVLDDLTLLAQGLPPVRMQVAARELVGRYRNRPVLGEPT
jgi:phosphoglycerate dehydrogenase-like enzyme